ncbi:MAG: GDP-mannose dehydrogenase [Thermofilum sp.]
MQKASVLVVGLGEVGRAVYEILKESGKFEVFGYDIDPSRTLNKLEEVPRPVVYLHVAIPYSSKFVEIVARYTGELQPRALIVHSSIAPGTTRALYERFGIPIAYTPVRGKHPNLKRHLLFWPKWVSALPPEFLEEAARHLSEAGFKVKLCASGPESLELAKLWETVYRAVMIASWQELHRVAREKGASLKVIAEFIGEVHEVLKDRPVYYPDFIGGHCLIPNTEILRAVHPSKLFDFVVESNEKRKLELKDPKVREEVEELKKYFLQLTKADYYE